MWRLKQAIRRFFLAQALLPQPALAQSRMGPRIPRKVALRMSTDFAALITEAMKREEVSRRSAEPDQSREPAQYEPLQLDCGAKRIYGARKLSQRGVATGLD